MNDSALLWAIIALPVLGAVSLIAIPRDDAGSARLATFFFSLSTFLASIPLFFLYERGGPVFQLTSDAPWLPAIHASLKIGIDGISLLLILLTTFLVPLTVLASWRSITERVKEFHAAILLLEAAMIGVFCARDLLLFYLFWEAMLVPMFLIIGVWGGSGRVKAALKFFIFTGLGSLLMLAAILYVYAIAGNSFDMETIEAKVSALRAVGDPGFAHAQLWLFAAFALAFAIKVPLFPLHTWLPHAHTEAPAAGSVILAAVMLKMGGYGFVRFAIPLFPEGAHAFAPAIIALAAIGVVYGALMALAQTDVKRLIAYSSVSHLALVVLGIFALTTRGVAGGVFQMLGHGLSTGALFLIVGAVYERRHTREVAELGGIAKPAPMLAACFVFATLASIAVPGTSGFVGEFLILLGVFETENKVAAMVGATGMVLGAAYMLLVVRRVFFGEAKGENARTPDMSGRELAYVVPVLAMTIVMGLYPKPFLDRIEPSAVHVVESARAKEKG